MGKYSVFSRIRLDLAPRTIQDRLMLQVGRRKRMLRCSRKVGRRKGMLRCSKKGYTLRRCQQIRQQTPDAGPSDALQ